MADADHTDDRRESADRTRGNSDTAEWVATSTLRIVLAVVGLFVLLFGLSMAMGVDLIGALADRLQTEIVQWLLVALVGLLLVIVAVRGFGAATAD